MMISYILLGVAAILLLTLGEIVDSRHRNECATRALNKKIEALFAECNALENKAQPMMKEYENECA